MVRLAFEEQYSVWSIPVEINPTTCDAVALSSHLPDDLEWSSAAQLLRHLMGYGSNFFSKKKVLDWPRVGEFSLNTAPFGPVRCARLPFEQMGAGLVSGGRVLFKYISFRSGPVCRTSF